ncbi:unnamed protein product [Nippostrongylus brasiliensis]|uniref:PhoLip_ATPase_C domain-containing protein n=1 Tax=Nippostrongylus brasiliensis TaxID=27835 RepID=A0A0N4XMF1_NIPBR|nr:unnamed protein product [Nippostrongylus brasiliensis]
MLSNRAISASVRCLSTAPHSTSGLCGPASRLLMIQYGIDQKDVKPTGPKGNVMKGYAMFVYLHFYANLFSLIYILIKTAVVRSAVREC